MPFVDPQTFSAEYNKAGLATPVGPSEGYAYPGETGPERVSVQPVTPGKTEIDQGSDAPDWSLWGAIKSGFREDNTVTNLLNREAVSNAPDGTDIWGEIKGTKYEPYWNSFVDDFSKAKVDATKRRIDQELEDRKTLEATPWALRLPIAMAAGTLDPTILLPGGAFVRGAKGGFSVLRTALNVGAAAGLQTAAQEAALQSMQETRSGVESGINIGASVLLGGLLGAGGAKLLTNAEWRAATQAIEKDLTALGQGAGTPILAPVGAAVVGPASLEANTIAGRATKAIAAATQRPFPILRILDSPSAVVRDIGTKLLENSVYLKKNFEGIASEPAVETLMQEWNGGLAKAIQATDEAYSGFRKAGGARGKTDFYEAVGRAMRQGDTSDDPFVTKAAQQWRSRVFDPLKDAAIKAKLLPEDVSIEEAPSYLTRMWNRNKLIAREGEFKTIVRQWVEDNMPKWKAQFDAETNAGAAKLKDEKLTEYLAQRANEADARFMGDWREAGNQIANDVFNTLTGKDGGESVRPEFVTVKARGPLKERTFHIPDALVEDFLESDVGRVGRRYTRIMGADVELANKFGSPDMKDQIQKIHDDYAAQRQGVTDEKALTKLDKREQADIRDIEVLRDLLRGVSNVTWQERNLGRLARTVAHFNYIRSMGEVVLASLTDAIRPAMVHGLSQYMQDVPKLIAGAKGARMSIEEAKLAGNIAERVLSHRLATISEIVDPYASRGPVEAFLENMTDVASKWNGIRIWTDAMKSIASVMTQNRILKNVADFAKAKPRERKYLAYLGIDESMAGRIAEQYAAHGEIVDGVHVANTEDWTDAVARRVYRAAMNKDVDSIIVERSVGDVPLFNSTPAGKLLLQFKSFSLAAHQRVLLRGLQEGPTRFLGGLIAMTSMGMFMAWAKAISGNRQEKLQDIAKNPGWWIAEGLDRSGIPTIPFEIANAFEKLTGFNPIKAPIKAFDQGAAQSQKMQNRNEFGSILGPSFGTGQDIISVVGILKTLKEGQNLTQGQKNAAERLLLPFNSYLGVRQMMRYLINPQAATAR